MKIEDYHINGIDKTIDYLLDQNKGDHRSCIANLIGNLSAYKNQVKNIKNILGVK